MAGEGGANVSAIRPLTWSIRSGHRSAYRSSVIRALEWPRMTYSVFGSAPAAIAMDAYE